ncbi:MAG: DUF1329 domain-containing protein [bacterium]
MRTERWVRIVGIALGVLSWFSVNAFADVSPGDVIDKSNWEKAEGLLPESVLNWVKKGDFILTIGKLNYDPYDFVPEAIIRNWETNKGKYALDETDNIVDALTGQQPDFVEGWPFPGVDMNDPKAAYKIMYNRVFYGHNLGATDTPFNGVWVGRGGYEREVKAAYLGHPMHGFPGTRGLENPQQMEKYSIIRIMSPVDISGTNVLTWRFLGDKEDMTYSYVPAIRRVRRMSPANRSDAFIGTDMCVDDSFGFDGKITSVDWKIIGIRETLGPFLSEDPQQIVQNEKGEWVSTSTIKPIVYGWEKERWTGAPWAPTNLLWVKRKLIGLEITPRDPYYNYGIQQLWLDARFQFTATYKIINDRAGNYWKTVLLCTSGFQSADQKMRFMQAPMYLAVDDRIDHATIVRTISPQAVCRWFCVQNLNMYSISGFQKLCK